jgi:Ca2+-binding RTX toxin-like protein
VSTGGDDVMDGREEADILLGGVGNDIMTGGLDEDILLGDSGKLYYAYKSDRDFSTLDLIKTTDITLPAPGGDDDISGGEADDIALGGGEGDTIFGDNTLDNDPTSDPGKDILIGDQGKLVFIEGLLALIQSTDTTADDGGNDTIEGNEKDDIIIGGVGGDDKDDEKLLGG